MSSYYNLCTIIIFISFSLFSYKTALHYSSCSGGTIRDGSVPPNNVCSKDWYDKLASDDKKSDDEHPVTDEREHVFSEPVQQQQVNDTARPQYVC